MTQALRLLGLHQDRWERATADSLWVAFAVAVAASVVLSLNRFGGLAVETPRAFLRMALIGVYGWLGVGMGIWLFAWGLNRLNRHRSQVRVSIAHSLVVAGFSHIPLLALGGAIFISATMLQVFELGNVLAWMVIGLWFPATLVSAARSTWRVSTIDAVLVVAVPYTVWIMTVWQHIHTQIQHLL
ncbi:MAG: hypothetical protein ACR2PK_06770 [Acidimicrobiales bacterium]